MVTTALFVCAALLAAPEAATAEDEKLVEIRPEDAADHIGERVLVTMEVKSTNNAVRRKTVFLDSHEDFRDEENLDIAIGEKGIADLKESKKIDEPARYFRDRTIRVKGKVVERDGRLYIDVEKAEQIEVVETEDEADAAQK